MNVFYKIYNFLKKKFIFYLLSILNHIIPKSNDKIFIYDKRFRKDNVWAIADYLSTNSKYKKYKIYYYAKKNKLSKNNIIFVTNPILALWIQLRSKYIFYSYRDVIQFKNTKNQVIVDTMHGSPLKRIGYLTGDSKFKKLWKFENTYTHILCVSDFFKEIIKKAFGASEEQCIVLGYPRNDYIFSESDALSKLDINRGLFSKIVLWMPTWRMHLKNNKNYESEINFPVLNSDNINSFNKFLSSEDILVIIKPHPNQSDLDFLNKTYSNIIIIKNEYLADKNVELYQIFSEVDALLTDYSSVFFDFLLTMKPIGFVIEDINSYGDKRGFVIENPLDIMPGEKIYNLNELIFFLKHLKTGIDKYYSKRKEINDIANKYKDGNSSKRIIEYLNI